MKSENNPTGKTAGKKANEKYSKSFLAKLIQSGEQTKKQYSVLKNELLSHKGVKCSFDWRWECFTAGKKTLARMRLRGKTLSICLALNAEDYLGTKYQVESVGDVKSLSDTPCMYLITDYKQLMYAVQLIDVVMEKSGVEKVPTEEIDYIAQYPYETTAALIKKKLIKVTTGSEDAEGDTEDMPGEMEQDVLLQEEDVQSGTEDTPVVVEQSVPAKKEAKSDAAPAPKVSKKSASAQKTVAPLKHEAAVNPVEKSDTVSDKTKSDIINIDTLSQYFTAGEKVTLSEIKKRVKGFNKKVTYIKVLARGRLDKPLTVEADSFSLQAIKRIALTGGKAIRKEGAKK